MKIMGKRLLGGLALVCFSLASLAASNADPRAIEAAKQQNWGSVRALINEGVDVNNATPEGHTALAWSVYWDDREITELLLQTGADPNIANDYGITPLFLAIRNRSHAMVDILLKGKADPGVTLWSGVTALMEASRAGVPEIVNSLLTYGVDVNVKEPRRDQTALMWSISFGYPEIAKLLIQHGADVSASTKQLEDGDYTPMMLEGYGGNVSGTERGGYTPLMFAARAGDLATTRLLLEAGADVNASSVDDGTALVIASANGHEDVALYLLQQGGANPNIAESSGITALHYAVRDGIKALHGYPIDFSPRVCGYAADSRCVAYDSLDEAGLAELNDPLLGLYIVEPRESRRTPFSGRNMHKLIDALLLADANPNAAMNYAPARLRMSRLPYFNLHGTTPMLLATASFDDDLVIKLLEAEADPMVSTQVNQEVFYNQTQRNSDDNYFIANATALMVAVGAGRKDDLTPDEEENARIIAEKLIDLGADVNEASKSGWTPLHAAAFVGANTLVELLVRNGARIDVSNGCGQTPFDLSLGMDTKGLINRTAARPDTARLLLELGAGNTKISDPIGECVLGRGGLELDIFQNEFVYARIKQMEEEMEQRQRKFQ